MNNIKLIIFDFDGVFTDGKCYFDSDNIIKYYNIKDGMGLKLVRENGIKTGLISSYSTDKNLIFKNDKNIISHLNFNYQFIGKCNKMEVLKKWIGELSIDFVNVAYIGDDLNDLEILEKVGFSGCPNDAINECKQKVNYICKKKGGDGCVREFIDLILEKKITQVNIIQEIKKEINYQLDNINLLKIQEISKIIRNCSGIIYTTGIGKSQNIAIQMSNLLKSISIKSFYLNPINSTHGDIGTICSNDIVIMLSKSGKTIELSNIIPYIKQRKCFLIGICNDSNNYFNSECDLTLLLPLLNEISGQINSIPSNSLISHQLFINILIYELKNNITLDKYKQNHPAGSIGFQLKKISDCLIKDFPKIILIDSVKLHDILLKMTQYKIGCCFFINNNDELLGILTDGDIRRLLIDDENLKFINYELINKNFYCEENLNKYICECKKYNYIPILCKKIIIGIVDNIN